MATQTKSELAEELGSQTPKANPVRPSPRRQDDEAEEEDRRPEIAESTDMDWSAELAWAPAPRPTPAPMTFRGPAPFQPGQRVRVDISGLPMLGVFAGKGASAA